MSRPAGLRRTGAGAPMLRWLLWTRRRAVITTLAIVLGSIVLARLLAPGHPSPHPIAAPPPTVPVTQAPVVPAAPAPAARQVQPVPLEAIPGGPAPGTSPQVVATDFAIRWVQHLGVDPTWWASGLAPWCTPEYGLQTLPTVDPSTVPATRVTGHARLVGRQQHSAEVDVPLDGLTIRVSLLDTADDPAHPDAASRWRVNDVNPAPGS